jgi:hypothetical protein
MLLVVFRNACDNLSSEKNGIDSLKVTLAVRAKMYDSNEKSCRAAVARKQGNSCYMIIAQ